MDVGVHDVSEVARRGPPGSGPAVSRPAARHLLVLLVGALAVRTGYVLTVLAHYAPTSDAGDYLTLATSVARGDGLSIRFPYDVVHPTAFRPPLYPLVLGGVFRVTGPSLGVAQAVNVALGSVVVVLVAVLAARFAGRRAGIAAGVLAAGYPPLLANDGPPLTEPLALVLLLTLLLALLDRRWAAAGVLAGLLVLTRPSAQLIVVVLAVWVLVSAEWKRAAAFVALAALVVAPWLARNALVFGTPVIVTSNGYNVAAVWSLPALEAGRTVDPIFDPRFAALRSGAASRNEARLDAAFREVGLRGLRSSLDEVPHVLARNSVYLLDLSTVYDNGAERLDGRNLRLRHAALPLVWLVLATGSAGLLLAVRRPGGALLLLTAVYFLLVSVVTVSPPRLRAPLDVLTVVGVAVVLSALLRRLLPRTRDVPG